MKHRNDEPHSLLQRTRIASAAARIMAEDGIADFDKAKRKAARSLGLPETAELPDSAEVEAELRVYQRLFQGSDHDEELDYLRRKAIELMAVLSSFRPYLTGAVLDGTAGPHAEIDLQLFVDSSKEVEIFLLNHRIDYHPSTPRTERAEAVLTLYLDDVVCNLIIYAAQQERVAFKTRSGKVRPRARLDALKSLLTPPAGITKE